VTLPSQNYLYTVGNDKIVRIQDQAVPHGGIVGVLEQVGVPWSHHAVPPCLARSTQATLLNLREVTSRGFLSPARPGNCQGEDCIIRCP